MMVALNQTSVGDEQTTAATWASTLILLQRICLIFCPSVCITNRNILKHNQDLDWTSLLTICSNKHFLIIIEMSLNIFNYYVRDKKVQVPCERDITSDTVKGFFCFHIILGFHYVTIRDYERIFVGCVVVTNYVKMYCSAFFLF